MISNLLRQLGFSAKEVMVYVAVLEDGRMTYSDLSRKTGLNRTTTYSATRALLDRGVLREDFSTPVKAVMAAPPEALPDMVAREETALAAKKKLAEQVMKEISTLPAAAGYVAPTITFIPQERFQRYLRERNDVWNDSLLKTDMTWWGFTDIDFVEKYSVDWLPWYWSVAPKEIRVKIFSNDATAERELQKQMPAEREIRFWQGSHVFTGSLWVIGEYVVTANVREKPHYMVEMHDRFLAHNLRTVFAALWESNR